MAASIDGSVELAEGTEFLDPDFDVEIYAQKLLENGTAISEHLTILEAKSTHLDKQLRQQVSLHHGKLLSQATSIESLEDILESLNQHIFTLKSGVDRVVGKTGELYKRAELHTQQLQRMHDTCNLLRAIIRIMYLSSKLKQQEGGNTFGSRDLVKNSQMLQEIADTTHEIDLSGIAVVEKDLISAPKLIAQIKEQARSSLRQGLRSQNHSLVGNALQAFCNVRCLNSQLQIVLSDMANEIDKCVQSLGRGQNGDEHRRQSSRERNVPGGASKSSRSSTPSSVIVRANLWNDVQKLADCLTSTSSQLDVLNLVLGKKKNAITHQLLVDEVSWQTEMYPNFWLEITSSMKERLSADCLVRQTLENEYPKFLRQMMDVFVKISPHSEEIQNSLRGSISQIETSYLFKSLSRLSDSVNLAFNDDSPPTQEEIDQIGEIVSSELQVAQFDALLFRQVARNVAKTVKLFAVKSEQLLSTDGEASQVIDNPSLGQKRNVAVVNALHKLRTLVVSHLDDRIEQYQKGLRSISSAPPAEAVESLLRACDQLLTLMASAVQPLLGSVEDAVAAIIDTVHQEDFNFIIPPNAAPADHQCSLYMRELQAFISRVWQDYLAPFACREFVYDQSVSVARKACRLFLIHTSLVRPIGEGGRLRLAADFAQMELAISPLCRRISVDLGSQYATLRAMRQLLFQAPEQVAQSVSIGNEVPYWLAIQLLISASPDELPSPHHSAGWSVARYSEWLEHNPNETERLQFLRGTLESYARSVQAQNKAQYVSTYPLLFDLLKRGVEQYQK